MYNYTNTVRARTHTCARVHIQNSLTHIFKRSLSSDSYPETSLNIYIMKLKLQKRHLDHLMLKLNIQESNIVTHAINTGHEFLDSNNMTLFKHII